MQAILFSLIYLSILFIPGVALQKILLPKQAGETKWLARFALSYTLFALSFTIAKYYSLSANTLCLIVLCELGLALICIVRKPVATSDVLSLSHVNLAHPALWIVGASALYQVAFGAFTEVPADIYAHLERFQKALAYFSDNRLGYALSAKQMLLQKSGVFYYLLALCNSYGTVGIAMLIELVDFINRTIFLLAIYQFTSYIFKSNHNSKNIALVATAATIFVALQMGISVIAYVRYYTFAPTMLNMVMYLAATVLFLELIKRRLSLSLILPYLVLLLILIAAATIHVQESIFIALIASAIVLTGLSRKLALLNTGFNDLDTKHAMLAFALSAIAFICLYVYSHLNLDRAPNAHWRLWEFGQGSGLIPDISILNLKKQFMQVLSLWGVLVYFLFFLNIARYKKNLFVLAAMLSPLITILNPFFVDLFLRHNNSTTLWRFCYLMPIHLVGADLLLHYIKRLRNFDGAPSLFAGGVVFLLIALLLPISNTWNSIHFSKTPTLSKSNTDLSYQGYSELISYLSSLEEKQRILTDPMLGYMLSATTKHTSQRQKFFRGRAFKDFTFTDYGDKPLAKYRGYLLITNTSQMPLSTVGQLSNHWSPNQWQMSHYYYTDALLENLESQPNRFGLEWSSADQAQMVYRIK